MIEIQLTNIRQLKKEFEPKKVEKAYRSALKKTGAKTKTRVSKDVRKTYNIKARDINNITRLYSVSHGVVISWAGKNLSLAKFTPLKRIINIGAGKPFGSKRIGVSVRIKKTSGRKLVKKGFQVTKLNNQIFQRTGGKMKSDPTKDAIKKMFGISIPQMVNDNILNDAANFIEQEMPIQFERAFKHFVGAK